MATASGIAASPAAHTNRLIHATSPYLQQHAHNPVDWCEWGPEAFEKARSEGKPIFLSIGYSACHWCHVMAHESFESSEIAQVMNRTFVNVKVDREERPDLDDIYMQATLAYTRGQGGWPMSVWLTPEGKPFAAGTYFPPTQKWGRPGFKEICEQIGAVWRERRGDVEQDAERLTDFLAGRVDQTAASRPATRPVLTLEAVDRTVDLLGRAFDAQRGGLLSGGTNKFPPSMAMDLLLRSAVRRGADAPRRTMLMERVCLTLDQMGAGGIYDQLGGGIHRYSTDPQWLVPHFEKMLYDQALVSRIYVDAFQQTKRPLYARIAREIFDYVIADLQSPEGGLYSTRDADSEGVEGKYYVWQRGEIVAALGPADAELFCSYYNVSEAGNWQDPHDPSTPKNILHISHGLEAAAPVDGIDPHELDARLAACRSKLLRLRTARAAPHRDEKILCEWNGLMIASLARGGGAVGDKRYVEAAARAADFVFDKQFRDGRLLRSYRDGRTLDVAFISDYAAMIDGLLELYEATFEKRWLERALALNSVAIEQYWDAAGGGFFTTSHDHEALILRSKEFRDSAVPSGNSMQLMNLLRLAAMTGDGALRECAERMMATFAADVMDSPGAAERFLAGVEFALVGPVEVAVVGPRTDSRTQALAEVVRTTYLPNRVLMAIDPALPGDAPASPLLEGRGLVGGLPAAYVCRNYACKLPVTNPGELAAQLAGGTAR